MENTSLLRDLGIDWYGVLIFWYFPGFLGAMMLCALDGNYKKEINLHHLVISLLLGVFGMIILLVSVVRISARRGDQIVLFKWNKGQACNKLDDGRRV
ncbi:prolipoprotein diacylglyceryltransferase [Skermanella aerolata]|uniref:hypothetical protein n=1 Tax=Skermanella aerolata TaxID=393310 RepID=UPI003D1C987B